MGCLKPVINYHINRHEVTAACVSMLAIEFLRE